ncbi:MAG: alkaline phosphatase [Pyrinomonadaceae bacterium]
MQKVVTILMVMSLGLMSFAQSAPRSFPIQRSESADTWISDGWTAIDRAKRTKQRKGKARNVILFIGDGMGISTLTAARIFEGQMRGASGEENRLSFEEFPYSALSKTYSANQQTSDSAPTAAAIVTGVKTDEGVLSVDQNVVRGDYKTVKGNETRTILELAEMAGKSTGIVSTARLTHATPGACYAHSPDRDWESDNDILIRRKDAHQAGFPDIARQLIEFSFGDGLEVALGGGRSKFLPKEIRDPEYASRTGERTDKRDLSEEWLKDRPRSYYIWNKAQFDAFDTRKTKHLLGLFEPSHMKWENDRVKDPAGEPSLAEMTAKAIDVLSNNKKGYFLMVEGGRIDHAHHDGNAYRALRDTVALSDAVRTAASKVDLEETLIIVTADHSHVFTIAGYPARGNNIVGLTHEVDENGMVEKLPATDRDKRPYTTLGYTNGTGYRAGDRPVLTQDEVTNPNFKQEATVPTTAETHGGEDVAIYAIGVNAHLIRGSMEQNWIFHVMSDAFRFERK